MIVHRLETNKIFNVAKLFAWLLCSDALDWSVLEFVRLTERDTNASRRIFIKTLFQEMSSWMGAKLKQRLGQSSYGRAFSGIFPSANPADARFAINFFTTIGLGGLTEGLRANLKQMQKQIATAQQAAMAGLVNPLLDSDSESSSSSASSSIDETSSDEADRRHERRVRKRRKRKRRKKRQRKAAAQANVMDGADELKEKPKKPKSTDVEKNKRKKRRRSSSDSAHRGRIMWKVKKRKMHQKAAVQEDDNDGADEARDPNEGDEGRAKRPNKRKKQSYEPDAPAQE